MIDPSLTRVIPMVAIKDDALTPLCPFEAAYPSRRQSRSRRKTLRIGMQIIGAAVALAALVASPASAQRLDSPGVDANGVHISGPRAEAFRECSIRASHIPEHIYEVNDLLIYR